MKRALLVYIFLIACIPAFFHLHIYEKDFLEILGSADGIYQGFGYCFLQLTNYAGIEKISGITARPYLIQFFLNISFYFLGHTLKAIYIVYLIPRLLILPVLYAITLFFFSPLVSFLIATLPVFFLYFETYAISTLKADVFVVFFSLLSLLFYLRWKKNNSFRDLLFVSLFLTFNVLSKETASLYSFVLGSLVIFRIVSTNKNRVKGLLWFSPISSMLIGPFVLFSLWTTGRLFPSLFATGYNVASFPLNSKTYLQSVLYYTGVAFNLSTYITFTSSVSLFLITLGIATILKRKKFELIVPILATLVGISLMDTRIVQGDIVGNREILHRIAFIVPFIALYTGFGIQTVASLVSQKILHSNYLIPGILFFVSLFFIHRYFTSPYALDYTQSEFYINAQTVFQHNKTLPLATFKRENDICITEFVPEGNFLVTNYKQFKTSAFPQGYKEVLLGLWGIPLLIWLGSILQKKNFRF